MRIKTIIAGILGAAAILGLTACGAKTNPDAEGRYTLGIGYTTAANDSDPYHITAATFKKIVEEKSGGRISVHEYPSSQLGSEPEMWEGMQIGTCDMAVMTNAYVSSYVRANGSLDLPFIFTNLEQARSIVDGEFG